MNASIRDAEWSVKKDGKGHKKPGLKLCASGLVTLYDALEKKEWSEREISERATWLCEQAKNIWTI